MTDKASQTDLDTWLSTQDDPGQTEHSKPSKPPKPKKIDRTYELRRARYQATLRHKAAKKRYVRARAEHLKNIEGGNRQSI